MNRRYSVKEYRAWVERAVQKVPDVCVGTDVLVGFPGETDDQFAATCELVRDLPLAYAHVFSYSARPGTPAARLGHPVPHVAIKIRNQRLSELSRSKRARFYQQFLDRDCQVLFESVGKDGLWTGLTDNFIRVSVASSGSLANQLRRVRLTGVMEHAALGKLADADTPRPGRVPIPVFQSFEKEAVGPLPA